MAGGTGSSRQRGVKSIHLTPKAIADLAEIRRFTRKTWGPAQARRYLQELGARFDRIAEGIAAARDAEIPGRDYHRSRCGAHVIFFAERRDHIRIVRIIHERQNFTAQLSDEE